jgi:hypothetical protein
MQSNHVSHTFKLALPLRKETYTEKESAEDEISPPRDKVTGKVKLPRV